MRKGGVLKIVEIVLELEIPVTAALCPHRPSSSKPQRSHVRSRDDVSTDGANTPCAGRKRRVTWPSHDLFPGAGPVTGQPAKRAKVSNSAGAAHVPGGGVRCL